MEIIYILVEPAVPENIGAAARAIKTMGFTELRLINTKMHLADEAKWLAHGSKDILEGAKTYNSFADAISDIDFTVGTTAKNRSAKFDYYTPEEGRSIITAKSDSIKKVGIIFGREESGLKNDELALCDIAITIPLKAPYPSINLAQSVMIITYVFSNCKLKPDNLNNNKSNYVLLKQKAIKALNLIGITEGNNLHGRIMERLSLSKSTDIKLLLSILSRFEKNLKNKVN